MKNSTRQARIDNYKNSVRAEVDAYLKAQYEARIKAGTPRIRTIVVDISPEMLATLKGFRVV